MVRLGNFGLHFILLILIWIFSWTSGVCYYTFFFHIGAVAVIVLRQPRNHNGKKLILCYALWLFYCVWRLDILNSFKNIFVILLERVAKRQRQRDKLPTTGLLPKVAAKARIGLFKAGSQQLVLHSHGCSPEPYSTVSPGHEGAASGGEAVGARARVLTGR